MRQVQKYFVVARPVQFFHDGAGNDIARRELGQRMIPRHETLSGLIPQVSALAPQGLGEQKPRRAFQVQGRRMELHELHIADLGAGPERGGHAIARRHVGVGGLEENTPDSAGGQQNRARLDRQHLASPLVENQRAPDGIAGGQ